MNKKLKEAINIHQKMQLSKALSLYKNLYKSKTLEASDLEILFINSANIYFLNKDYKKAEKFYKKALFLNKNNEKTYFNLGVLYLHLDEDIKAIEFLNKAIKLKPDYLNALINKAVCQKRLKKYPEALKTFEKALFLDKNNVDALYNRANVYYNLDKFEKAIIEFEKIIKLDKNYYKAYYSKGISHLALKEFSKALFSYEKALEIKKDYADAHFAKSNILLLYGDLIEGFKEYDYRWQANNELKKMRYNVSFYNGEDLSNKTILIQQEQGFGDNIQFSRFIFDLLRKNPKKVYFAVSKPLRKIFQNSFLNIEFVENNQLLVDVDYFSSLICLARIFKITINKVEFTKSYLKPVLEPLRFNISKKYKFNVAFCWQGNKDHKNDKNRSISIKYFEKLFSNENIGFYSLQLDEKDLPLDKFPNLFDCSPYIGDFNDSANILKAMDLVISIDSSLVHLSASLGVKTWALIPFIPDFRWLIDRKDSYWYESLELFRQKEYKNWENVILEVNNRLQIELNEQQYKKHLF